MDVSWSPEKSQSHGPLNDPSKLREETMKIRSVVALVGLAISFAVPTFAQQANDLVGAWTLVSITLEKDGKKTDFYGPNPQGQLMYDANDVFPLSEPVDLPKFASNNRESGTPEENKDIVQGSLA